MGDLFLCVCSLRDLSSLPGIEHQPPALKAKIQTTRSLGKPLPQRLSVRGGNYILDEN